MPTALDVEKLLENTAELALSNRETEKQRSATLHRLAKLGISKDIIAKTCKVKPKTVASWYGHGTGPRNTIARLAIDRVAVVLSYMEEELGLGDKHIAQFLIEEPRVPEEEQRDWTYDHWHPDQQAREEDPIIMAIGHRDGPSIIARRFALRFAERQMVEQAGIVVTPITVV